MIKLKKLSSKKAFALGALLVLAVISMLALNSTDIDEVCNQDDNMLLRDDGTWGCIDTDNFAVLSVNWEESDLNTLTGCTENTSILYKNSTGSWVCVDSSAYIDSTNEGNLNVNRSDYWDSLDTPADINAGDITDDDTYVLVAGDSMGDLVVNGILNVTGTSYLGNAVLNLNNLSINEIRPITESEGIKFTNTTGAKVMFINTTSGKTEFWSPAEGANDYISIYHDGSNGYVQSQSGVLYLGVGGTGYYWLDSTRFVPAAANLRDLGATTSEFRGLYLGEDANSGAYFGLDQDWRLYYNETDADELQLVSDGLGKLFINDNGHIELDGGSGTFLHADSNSNAYISVDRSGTNREGSYDLYTAGVHDWSIGVADSDEAGDGTEFFIAPSQTSTGAPFWIETTGNVGIGGQTAPAMALHVGGGSSSHSLTNSENDTYITGKLEVDGLAYFDNSVVFTSGTQHSDNVELRFGSSNDVRVDWSTSQATENTLIWGLGDVAKSLIFTIDSNKAKDFDHPAQSTPSLIIHSDEDPDTNNTQWGSIAHDTSSFVIDSGTDSIILDDTTNVAGNLNLGDNILGEDKFRMCYNGSETVLDMYSANNTLFSCSVNNTGSFVCSSVSTWSCT